MGLSFFEGTRLCGLKGNPSETTLLLRVPNEDPLQAALGSCSVGSHSHWGFVDVARNFLLQGSLHSTPEHCNLFSGSPFWRNEKAFHVTQMGQQDECIFKTPLKEQNGVGGMSRISQACRVRCVEGHRVGAGKRRSRPQLAGFKTWLLLNSGKHNFIQPNSSQEKGSEPLTSFLKDLDIRGFTTEGTSHHGQNQELKG